MDNIDLKDTQEEGESHFYTGHGNTDTGGLAD